ncbi:hypothetical protein I5Q34_25260 [Streptomyces sp. AV19]|uniref:hypothetical protein n=1 Tax=Streptomyces sp. AV19 TaxID=2793068 RepID=UPI0018FEE3F3|nr:hypothetical protein [Streptomyces sp. AV19]MBH1937539.1 hypothetical protein [Streptomyces sp. AV19]MDG4533685.1 hypothetical protein [Streptomyces sp. AV19]
MRSTTAAAVFSLVLALTAVGVTGCGSPDRLHVEGPAPSRTREVAGPVYVSDAMGRPLRRPTSFGVTEHTSLFQLRWQSWGGAKATATGRVSGLWCPTDACSESGYPATVELSGLEDYENVAYYTRAGIRSSRLPPDQAAELREVRLPIPER